MQLSPMWKSELGSTHPLSKLHVLIMVSKDPLIWSLGWLQTSSPAGSTVDYSSGFYLASSVITEGQYVWCVWRRDHALTVVK